MKIKVDSFALLKIDDVIETFEDVHLWIGGPLYCEKNTKLIVTEVLENAFKACPEGGKLGHYFCGPKILKTIRKIVEPLHQMQTDSRKDGTQKQQNKN